VLSYTFQFFFGLLLWLPVFYEYQRQIGLSDAQIFGIPEHLLHRVLACSRSPPAWSPDRLRLPALAWSPAASSSSAPT